MFKKSKNKVNAKLIIPIFLISLVGVLIPYLLKDEIIKDSNNLWYVFALVVVILVFIFAFSFFYKKSKDTN